MEYSYEDMTAEIPSLRPETMNLVETDCTPIKSLSPQPQLQQQVQTESVSKTANTPKQHPRAADELAIGMLQIVEPPLEKVRGQIKEVIARQNKIYVDISAEKFQLDSAEIVKLNDMMNNVKVYRDKLVKIKKQMQNIYQRTNVLKKRAANIQACKQKELQRKQQKQQQEVSLIGGGK